MGKRDNHASYSRAITPPSMEKAKWELYLEELGLEDETAIHALRHGTGAAAEIRYPSEQSHSFHRSDCMMKWRHARYESGC